MIPHRTLTPIAPELRLNPSVADRYLVGMTSSASARVQRTALTAIGAYLLGLRSGLRYTRPVPGVPRLRLSLSAVPFHEIAHEQALALRSVIAQEFAPATANRWLAALRGVFDASQTAGLLSAERLNELRKATRRVPGSAPPSARALAVDELQLLLQACAKDTRASGRRDAAVLALIFSGLRRAEVSGLQLASYQRTHGLLRVEGKGRRVRDIPLHEGARACLDAWIELRGEHDGPLLHPVNRGGAIARERRFDANGVYDACKKRAQQAGVQEFAPHDARRWACGAILDVSELSTAASYLGHSDLRTTARYDTRGMRRLTVAVSRIDFPIPHFRKAPAV